jgi:hypothetical protein
VNPLRRLRIESDGKEAVAGGTKVFDADTGEQIKNVRSVTFHAEAGKVPTVTVEIVNVSGIEVLATGDGIFAEYSKS